MIIIKKCGKFIVPQDECFIGYAGDNLKVTKEIFVEGITDLSLAYRMYLKFDDGSCNFFLLDSEVQENGTMLVWNVTNDQIFKSGVVQVQVKASNNSGEVFHSSITNMLVQTSIEFTDYFKNKENSEFLHMEETLNGLYLKQEQANQKADNTLSEAQSVLNSAETVLNSAETVLNSAEKANDDTEELLAQIDEKMEEFSNMDITIEMDNFPTANSTNAVKSGGLYSALNNKANCSDIGYISNLSMLKIYKDVNAIYTAMIDNQFIEGEAGYYTFCKIVAFADRHLVYLPTGRVYSKFFDSDDLMQVVATSNDIVNTLFDSYSEKPTINSSMVDSASYSYKKMVRIIHYSIDLTVKTPIEGVVSADLSNLPYLTADKKVSPFLTFSDSLKPYLVTASNGMLSVTPIDLTTLTPVAPVDNDTINVQFTFII